jgi:hypothetical protein
MKPHPSGLKVIDNGAVDGFPQSLVCGNCGAPSGVVMWQTMGHPDGTLAGAFGIANCSRCDSGVVGLLANDPAFMHDLRQIAEEVLRDS